MTHSSALRAMAFAFIAVAASAQTAPRQGLVPPIFVKAVRAFDRLKFSGERIVEFQQGPNRRSHTEYVLHQGVNSRVWFPPGSQFGRQVIIETANERLHYFPGRNEIEVLPPAREEAFIRLREWIERPGRAIRLSTGGLDRVAGRPTEIGIVSDARGNVRQRLWIDTQTGLILKRELLDNVGMRVGYFEFTQVDYNPVIHAGDFTINVRGAVRLTLVDKIRRLAARNNFVEAMLPPGHGFFLDAVNVVRPAGLVALHQSYSGPHGKLSLFQTAGSVDLHSFQSSKSREVQFFGWEAHGHSFALVGAYSEAQLRSLAQLVDSNGNGP